MTAHSPIALQRTQRGAATLIVVLLLSLAMAFVAYAASRSLIVEQHSAANHTRATNAFELAQAGLDWASARMNDPRSIDAACLPAAKGRPFRERFMPRDATAAFTPSRTTTASCRMSEQGLQCSCPTSFDPETTADEPGFTVWFERVPDNARAVRATSIGCTRAPCDETRTADNEAIARVSAAFEFRSLIRQLPAAPLTAGGRVVLEGPTHVENSTTLGGGLLVDAGHAIDLRPGPVLVSRPGTPAKAMLGADNVALARLAADGDGRALRMSLFGLDAETLGSLPAVKTIDGSDARERGRALAEAYGDGYRAFDARADLLVDTAALGSPADPVLLIGRGTLACAGPCDIDGLVYIDRGIWQADGIATLRTRGAIVTRGDHEQTRGGTVIFDPVLLAALQQRLGVFVLVPGTWSDL